MKMESRKIQKIRKDMFLSVVLISFLIFLVSCNKNSKKLENLLENTIISVSSSNDHSNKVVDLRKVYSFDWDVLYIFGKYTSVSQINEVIGFECTDCYEVPDATNLYLFVYEGGVTQKFLKEYSNYHFAMDWYGGYELTQKIEAAKSEFKILNKETHFALIPVE